MKFTINFGKNRNSNNQSNEQKRHDDIIRNLQMNIDKARHEIDALMRELSDNRNQHDMHRRQQTERKIDDLKGLIARFNDQIEKERDEFRKRMQHIKR